MTAPLRRAMTATAVMWLFGMLAAAGGADAATYTVFSCRGPEGAPVSTRAWQGDVGDTGLSDGCPSGEALSARVAGPRNGTGLVSGLRFIAPPGAQIAGYRIHLSAVTGAATPPGALQAGLSLGSLIQLAPVSAGCPFAGCVFGDPGQPLADANLVTAAGIPTPGLVLVARCGAGACQPPGPDGSAARVQLWRSVVDLVDGAAPTLSTPSGSLLAPGAAAGRASIAALTADAGGGVAAVTLRIDGIEHAQLDAGGDCARPYTVAAPCPATLPAAFETDTRTLSDGPHVAELRVTDAAGQTAGSGPIPFSVSNAAGGGGAAAVPVVPTQLTRAEIDLNATRFTLPAGGRAITGVVRRQDGASAAGAQIVVRSRRFGAGAPRRRTERTLRTDSAGRFSIPVGTTARRVVLTLEDPAYRPADSDEVQIRGALRITLKASGSGLRNGSTMTLGVRIRGAGDGAADGRPVLVQALVDRRWVTVDSLESDASGRASWRYRFRNTTRATRYRFRVQVPRGGADWPWPVTSSRAVSVRVSP